MRWQADYWDGRRNELVPFIGATAEEWKALPREPLVRLTVTETAHNGKTYSMRKQGCDWTFLAVYDEGYVFGGWNEDGRPSRCVLWPWGEPEQREFATTFGEPDTGPISNFPRWMFKGSCWIPEPYAEALGFSGGISRDDWEYIGAEEQRAGIYDRILEELGRRR